MRRDWGRGAPPTPHCSTETPVPYPTRDLGEGTRGLFLVSGWTRSLLPRGGLQSFQSPHPAPSLVPPVWFGGWGSPFFSLSPCLFDPLSSVLSPSLVVFLFFFFLSHGRLFSLCPPLFLYFYFCSVFMSLLIPVFAIFRAGLTKVPDSFLYLPRPHNESLHKQKPNSPTGTETLPPHRIKLLLCLRRLFIFIQ